MASVSDSSSMLSLSVSSGHGQGQVTGMGNEGGPSHMSHGHMEMRQMMEQDTGMLRWEGDEDEGGGQFEASFTMPDGVGDSLPVSSC